METSESFLSKTDLEQKVGRAVINLILGERRNKNMLKIFDNGINEEQLTSLQQGFFSSLIWDAEEKLEFYKADYFGLSDKQYEKLKKKSFSINNISLEALEKGKKIVDDFVSKSLNDNQREKIMSMSEEDQRAFGFDLYDALLYDDSIIADYFKDAVPPAQNVDESGTIGMSVDGDVRIFFE